MRLLTRLMLVLPMLCIAGGSLLLATRTHHAETELAAPTVDCSALDQLAAARVATLIPDQSAHGELRLDEALAQLRRARRFCRSGYSAIAEKDYRALERAIPDDLTASISSQGTKVTK